MLNQVVLVGRLVRTPELELTDTGKKRSVITLAVSRGYKNQDGEYETDFFDCVLWTGIAENTSEYCKSGDVIGVKGRLQTWIIENEDGSKYKKVEVVAEKVTFLSSAKNNREDSNYDTIENEDSGDVNTVNESQKKYNKKKK
jgi:single-strand DNA-binding protein